jgi:hypothetical protein
MNEFLREYKPHESREPVAIWKYALGALGVLIVVGIGWWLLRDRDELGQVESFIADLQAKNYDAAYARFGCTPAKPCRDYSKERFLEDWGPASIAKNTGAIKLTEKRSCGTSVIQTLDLGGGETVVLIINRADKVIGFAPYKVCNPRQRIG